MELLAANFILLPLNWSKSAAETGIHFYVRTKSGTRQQQCQCQCQQHDGNNFAQFIGQKSKT